MTQLWKCATQSVACGGFSLMRIPTAAWKSLAKNALGFPTFTTGPTTINKHGIKRHLKNYKGRPRRSKIVVLPQVIGAAGVVSSSAECLMHLTCG
jgi:hypothetical protein